MQPSHMRCNLFWHGTIPRLMGKASVAMALSKQAIRDLHPAVAKLRCGRGPSPSKHAAVVCKPHSQFEERRLRAYSYPGVA
jgi:hypothetical protein